MLKWKITKNWWFFDYFLCSEVNVLNLCFHSFWSHRFSKVSARSVFLSFCCLLFLTTFTDTFLDNWFPPVIDQLRSHQTGFFLKLPCIFVKLIFCKILRHLLNYYNKKTSIIKLKRFFCILLSKKFQLILNKISKQVLLVTCLLFVTWKEFRSSQSWIDFDSTIISYSLDL